MNKYIKQFRDKFKHSQFVDYAKIEAFLLKCLKEQAQEIIDGMPVEEENNRRDDLRQFDIGYNQHIRELKAYKKQVEDNLNN